MQKLAAHDMAVQLRAARRGGAIAMFAAVMQRWILDGITCAYHGWRGNAAMGKVEALHEGRWMSTHIRT